MLPFLTANRSPILMCRGPVRYTEPAGRPHTPRTKPKLFNQNQTPHLQTQKEKKNCFFVAVVDALQKQKKKTREPPSRNRRRSGKSRTPTWHIYRPYNENTHTMLRSAQLNRASSQFFPEMSSFLVWGGESFLQQQVVPGGPLRPREIGFS